MNLEPISKREFDALDGPRRLNESPFSKGYYRIDLGVRGGIFGVGCSNELAPPTIIEHLDWWIGVDCEMAVVGRASGRILLLFVLPSRFQFFSPFDDLTVVACETDILVFNKDRTLRTFANLSDVITTVERGAEALSVTTLSAGILRV